jgi:hypothetical protein
LQPQSSRHRAVPCAQLHDVCSASITSQVAGTRAEFGVVGEPRAVPALLDLAQCPCQRHVAVAVVVAVGLAVGRDVAQRRPAVLDEAAVDHPRDDLVTVGEQALERDRLRRGAVVEEQIDRVARRQGAAIGAAGLDGGGPPRATRRPPRLGLVRREHREHDEHQVGYREARVDVPALPVHPGQPQPVRHCRSERRLQRSSIGSRAARARDLTADQ